MLIPEHHIPTSAIEQVDAFDWQSEAWLVGVPRERRPQWITWVLCDIAMEWRHVSEPGSVPVQMAKADAEIARAARAFIRALEQRDELVDRKMARLTNAFLRYVKVPARGRRRSAGRFERFVEHLLFVTYTLGGKVTCNRKAESGTILELLNDLRPMMPPGFIPQALPLHTIDDLCTEARGFGRITEAYPQAERRMRLLISARPRFLCAADNEVRMAAEAIEDIRLRARPQNSTPI